MVIWKKTERKMEIKLQDQSEIESNIKNIQIEFTEIINIAK